MTECGKCHAQLRPGISYCTNCGTRVPAPVVVPVRREGVRPVFVVAALSVLLVVAAVVAVQRYQPPPTTGAPVAQHLQTTTEPQTTTTTVSVDPADQARQALARQVARDRAAAETLVGHWVPQLSSKRLGIVVQGVPHGHLEIWQDFQLMVSRYPGAILLWSGDFSTFSANDFWVTVMPLTYPTGEAANSWCDQRGIDRDNCYAKLLSHVDGPNGTTKLR